MLDLYRGIRTHLASLLSASSTDGQAATSADGSLDPRDLNTMSLGLSHSLSRYKLKFSPDKVDTMVVQAIGLLDDLDKEVNIYAMRVKEWYGWHFPEMAKLLSDNMAYAKCIKIMGFRTNAATSDFSEVLPEEVEETLKAAAEISMGTEISEVDLEHIQALCDQVISITTYRAQLFSYLQNRMNTIAPNLTALVGELVGARLISHAGSLMHLAKQPASTVQILGAEKALFRALKTKHDTPKYGLIYHASLVGQAPNRLKGKMARMVATKAALSIRLDALADGDTKEDYSVVAEVDPEAVGAQTAPQGKASIGAESRARLENKLRTLEAGAASGISNGRASFGGGGQKAFGLQQQNGAGSSRTYNAAADSTAPVSSPVANGKKRSAPEDEEEDENAGLSKEEKKAAKKAKKEAKKAAAAAGDVSVATTAATDGEELSKEERKALKKAKKAAAGDVSSVSVATTAAEDTTLDKEKKKAAKKAAKRAAEEGADVSMSAADASSEKKKKKRSKSAE